MFDKQAFSERLKETRSSKKITQDEISRQLKVTRSAYAAYETGKNMPPLEVIFQLVEILKVDFDWLVKGEGKAQESNETQSWKDKYIEQLEKNAVQSERISQLMERLLEQEKAEKNKSQEESQKL